MGKEEGTLQVMNSEIIITCAEGAIPPKIQTAEGLEISINGTMIKETTTVLPGDTVTCTCGELYSEGCTELNISNDGLKAMLRIKKGTMTYYDILDCPATEVLQPQTKKTTITESINKEYILERLKTEGIIQGVDSEAIEYVLSKQDGQWTTIASGISPQQGTDAYMQTLYASSDYSLPKADVLENIDYREKGTITTVDKDTLLEIGRAHV